jgi:hypothetical protein
MNNANDAPRRSFGKFKQFGLSRIVQLERLQKLVLQFQKGISIIKKENKNKKNNNKK